VRFLTEHEDLYTVIHTDHFPDGMSNDEKIVRDCQTYVNGHPDAMFWTEDLLCYIIAKQEFRVPVRPPYEEPKEEYSGFKTVDLSDVDMARLYENPRDNFLNLTTNEYLEVRNSESTTTDVLRWDGEQYVKVKIPKIKSNIFGAVKPYKGDIYQTMALDSFANNQVTMIKGHAGTGKSYLAIGYLLDLLEKHKIDQIVVFANPVSVSDACRLGFYPGTKDDKLLDSQVGNMLAAKIGDKYGLQRMIDNGDILLLPMSDIRGYDTSGKRVGVYITEAQNFSINLMKIGLQRIGEDVVSVIIDGDYTTQVDRPEYGGNNNGMRRMSEVFRGQPFYGEVELRNIYRSMIAKVADEM
jgi:predicted ribonuclease YlaK